MQRKRNRGIVNIASIVGVAALGTFPLSATLRADTVTFEMIPSAAGANDMSPDGRFIVGESDFDGDGFPDGSYLYDTLTGILTDLSNAVDPTLSVPAVAVSDDGTVVLGNMSDPNDPNSGGIGNVAGIWRASTGMWESLGYLPNAGRCPSRSSGYELSADGSIATGLSWDGCSARGFVWRAETGMLELQNLANGNNRASVLSADGSLMGGFAQGSFSRTPAIWDGSTRAGQTLDPNADALGEVRGMRDDGSIMLGNWQTTEQQARAVRWTRTPTGWDRTMIENGSLRPGWDGLPMDIADNGTIVGFDNLGLARRAWIQPHGTGPLIGLKPFVESHGGVVPDGLVLEVCQAISRDGRFIVGHGFATGAWRITITPCVGDVDDDNDIDLADLAIVLAQFGQSGGGLSADVDNDGDVDLADLAIVLGQFGNVCS